MIPPYSGIPRLSHQFPVADVVVMEVVTVLVVEVEFIVVGVVVVVVVVVVAIVVCDGVVVADLQDAKSNDVTRRIDSDNNITPLFM